MKTIYVNLSLLAVVVCASAWQHNGQKGVPALHGNGEVMKKLSDAPAPDEKKGEMTVIANEGQEVSKDPAERKRRSSENSEEEKDNVSGENGNDGNGSDEGVKEERIVLYEADKIETEEKIEEEGN